MKPKNMKPKIMKPKTIRPKTVKILITLIILVLISGCATTGKTSYVKVDREEPKKSGIFWGVMDTIATGVGVAIGIASGNPLNFVNASINASNARYEFESVNKQTLKVEEKEDGTVEVKPID